ncbi:LysR family transcriptional regulator [Parapedobacter sp. ISTM3]|uniref:LysR family transcriptional regulator n=1 Tax=Parapedobacter sp. ISTM3 TaxID=2800130 RepID=UPI0019064646|nr:LysR family transcriptional regulator [Parapedobacter sp. ISTM3]MBK1442394.1 LysR family transcriptional regulator [Parapedobacter sp. ISTM3]
MLSTSHRVFLEVAAHLSFSRAAKLLFISQPAVSRHIKLLEEQYKFALFARSANGIQLTSVGEKVYSYLSEAQELQRKIDYEISTLQSEQAAKGNLLIGASTTVSLYIIPALVSGFLQEFKKVFIRVVNRNMEHVIHALMNKEIDLGIVEVDNKLGAFSYDYFTSDRIIVVCSPLNPITRKDTFTLDDLVKAPIALRENGSGTLAVVQRELDKAGVSISDLNTQVRLGGTEALKNYLLADRCIGFVPQRAVAKELASGELVELTITGLTFERDFFFVRRKGDDFELTKRFIRFCKQQTVTGSPSSSSLNVIPEAG